MKKHTLSNIITGSSIFTAISAFSFVISEMEIRFMAHSRFEWLEWSLLIMLFSLLLIFSYTLSDRKMFGIMIGYFTLPFSFLVKQGGIHFFLLSYNTGICFGFWSIAVLMGIHLLSEKRIARH